MPAKVAGLEQQRLGTDGPHVEGRQQGVGGGHPLQRQRADALLDQRVDQERRRARLEPPGAELAAAEQQQDVERVVHLLGAQPAVAVVPAADLAEGLEADRQPAPRPRRRPQASASSVSAASASPFLQRFTQNEWRRGWDSNPRAGCPTRRFRGAPVTTTSVPLRKARIRPGRRDATHRTRRTTAETVPSVYATRGPLATRVFAGAESKIMDLGGQSIERAPGGPVASRLRTGIPDTRNLLET